MTSVYDTTSVDSFNSLQTWYNEMGTYCTNPDAVTMLVGNKTDRKVFNVTIFRNILDFYWLVL